MPLRSLILLLLFALCSSVVGAAEYNYDNAHAAIRDEYSVVLQRFEGVMTSPTFDVTEADVRRAASTMLPAYNGLPGKSNDERRLTVIAVTNYTVVAKNRRLAKSKSRRQSVTEATVRIRAALSGPCRKCTRDAKLINVVYNERRSKRRRRLEKSSEYELVLARQNRMLSESNIEILGWRDVGLTPAAEAALQATNAGVRRAYVASLARRADVELRNLARRKEKLERRRRARSRSRTWRENLIAEIAEIEGKLERIRGKLRRVGARLRMRYGTGELTWNILCGIEGGIRFSPRKFRLSLTSTIFRSCDDLVPTLRREKSATSGATRAKGSERKRARAVLILHALSMP